MQVLLVFAQNIFQAAHTTASYWVFNSKNNIKTFNFYCAPNTEITRKQLRGYLLGHPVRYDAKCYFNNAILTCARKPTWVSLIYRTEPTTKKCKTEKLKSRKQICSEITRNSLGNLCNKSWRRKRKGCGGKDLQKSLYKVKICNANLDLLPRNKITVSEISLIEKNCIPHFSCSSR